ncbi:MULTISPECIES: LysR family transcriptional regulator [Solibacillus]|uniref:LysR family transcriptional regulator n=1 Tax=Solibacillus faecavium TaxID=2762221 RepID=A0ABR8XWW1_9BACL|nr:LysR family transcriptional regulator [Solibacillus faecavium]MBD8036410.1 LysR family transcriptional regulator [Solibacillus faecavium]
MSLVKYEILNKVAEVHSFTKAATSLGLTQSAVSHAISSLEKEFGFNLIHRNRTGVTLTEDGMQMLYEMRKVLSAQEHLQQAASNILGVSKGTVRIGLISTISTHWMPNIIHIMDSEYPGIRIELREGDYYEIEQWLLKGEVDCGFLNRTSSKQFDFMPLKRDPLLCIVSSHSPLYDRTEIDLLEIGDTPIIMPYYKGTNDVMTTFEKYGVQPNIRFELYDEKAIVSMVEHNVGISILPEMAISMLPDNVKALPLAQESFRTIGLSTKQKLSPASKKFVEILKNWLVNVESKGEQLC